MANGAFLVVEPVTLVAEDLAACIADALGAVEVIVAATLEDAAQRLTAVPAPLVRLALLHAAPDDYAGSLLSGLLRAVGATVAFMGGRAEEAAATDSGVTVLEQPFSTETVRAFLTRLGYPTGPGTDSGAPAPPRPGPADALP